MTYRDPEKAREYQRRWRAAHPEKKREYDKHHYEQHRDVYAERNRGWRKANPDLANAKSARYRSRHPEEQLLKGARHRGRKFGVPCTLTRAFVANLIAPMKCSATGIPLQHALGNRGPGQWSPSIDRIVPALGYVPGNVRLVCHSFNVVRQYMTDAEAVQRTQDRFAKRLGGPLA